MGHLRPFLLVCGPGEVVVYYWAMLPCNCTGCVLGRASRTRETAQFSLNLRSRKRGLNGVVSDYLTSMNLSQVEGCQRTPRIWGVTAWYQSLGKRLPGEIECGYPQVWS